MSWLAIIGSAIGTIVLGLIGRFAFYRWGRERDENRELTEQVDVLEDQLREQQNAPRDTADLVDRLKRHGM